MGYEDFQSAVTQRSLRSVRAELEFLADTNVITQQQLSTILSNLPADSATAPQTVGATTSLNNLTLNNPTQPATSNDYPNEKATNGYGYPAEQHNPPPAYNSSPPQAAPLTHAVALYAYTATDAGDLNLQPNDRIAVTEYMNAEWWKGRSERTGAEGIFPRSYVRVDEAKAAPQPTNYGNMPLDVASGAGAPGQVAAMDPNKQSKLQEGGKKFGKKLGNAAIFGAGATIGSNIVNGIF